MTDFSRDVVCILGMPFDVVGIEEAAAHIHESVALRKPLLISTANVNFVVAARADEKFRGSVLQSELIVADGAPIVWVARLLGLPVRTRVSGADLFRHLERSEAARPIKVFFFGGPEGMAEKASRRLNAHAKGLNSVGFEYPGFVSVEAMGGAERIGRINDADPDFVVVSLGAKKGHDWIDRNRPRLRAPVISHLGAVVNFVAGSVSRAPAWMQRSGLEWAWRIGQEPALWKRYWSDGLTLLRLLGSRVLPLWWAQLGSRARAGKGQPPQIASVESALQEGSVQITLGGGLVRSDMQPVRDAFTAATRSAGEIRIDLAGVTSIDAGAVGLLLLLHGHQRAIGRPLVLHGMPPAVRRQFHLHAADFLIDDSPDAQVSISGAARGRA